MVSRKRVLRALRAERRTKKVGSGIEFADHRDYPPGDDFRYLDWNVYGRLDKLLLRLFEEEEDLHIYILVDVSDSMSIGSPLPKLHYAKQVGAALAYVGLANLDRVVDHPVRATGSSTGCRRRAARSASSGCSTSCRSATIGGKTELAECMKTFVAQNKRRGLAVVISDFYDPQGFEQGINMLRYNKFEPFVLQVVDQREATPKLHGDVALFDCETGDTKEVTVSKSLLEAYEREHEKYCKELEALLHEVRDAVLPHPHLDPVRRARAEDLPVGRLPAMSFLGPIGFGLWTCGRGRRRRARGRRVHHQDAAPPLRGAVRAAVEARARAEGRERAVEAAQAARVAAADPR